MIVCFRPRADFATPARDDISVALFSILDRLFPLLGCEAASDLAQLDLMLHAPCKKWSCQTTGLPDCRRIRVALIDGSLYRIEHWVTRK